MDASGGSFLFMLSDKRKVNKIGKAVIDGAGVLNVE
jgi:hypothetical protein